MNVLTLKFKATEFNGWPKIQILIDEDLIEDHQFHQSEEDVNITLDLLDGPHELAIERYGKTDENLSLDSQGNILEDQTLELVGMLVDGVNVPEMFNYQGDFRTGDQIYKQSRFWGPNGVWIWEFGTPIITWMLEEVIVNDEKYTNPEIPFKEYIKDHDNQVDRLRKLLDDME